MRRPSAGPRWLAILLPLLIGAGCTAPGPVAVRPSPSAPQRVTLPAFDTNRIERALVRSEPADRMSEPERRFVQAREAYWNGDTAAAVAGFRSLLAMTNSPHSPPYVQRLILQCLEESGLWADAAAAYHEFGLAQSMARHLALADALAVQPVPTLQFDADGSPAPMRLARGQLVLVEGWINGRKARLFVDTGFSRTLVSRRFADDLKIAPLAATVRLTDANGRRRTAGMAVIDDLRVAGLAAHHIPVVVGDTRNLQRIVGDVDAVIGWDLLQRAEVTFDFPRRELTLRAPTGGPVSEPNLTGRHSPLLTVLSAEGHPLDLFFDSGYASRPPTLGLYANAGLLASKVDEGRFYRSWRPRFSLGMHSFSVSWPRRARNLAFWFEGLEFRLPLTVLQREVEVLEGLGASVGILGTAPFLGGVLRLDGTRRQAGFAAPPGR